MTVTTDAPQEIVRSGIVSFYLTGTEESTIPIIRGRFARLFTPASDILNRHDYPDAVGELCAESMALAACLSATLKFDGVFTLQAKGDGAVRTLFSDVTSEGHVRCYAAFDEAALADVAPAEPSVLPRLMGGGYMAFTIDQSDTDQRYQGIVELDGPHLGDAAETWFRNSEQMATKLIAAAQKTDAGWVSSALFLQQIAVDGGNRNDDVDLEDAWHTALMLMSSVKRTEMLDPDLPDTDLLFRLFNAQALHIQEGQTLTDSCRCSDDKVYSMLKSLSEEQLRDLVDETQNLSVECEFCKRKRIHSLGDILQA